MEAHSVSALGVVAVFAIAALMLRTWLTHVEKLKGLASAKRDSVSSDARLERLEQAVESIAIEIERVSEGQRFVTKLMSEKAQSIPQSQIGAVPVPVPGAARRVDTPH